MRFTTDSPITFTPDVAWELECTSDDGQGTIDTWTLPVIGWAVVVDWVDQDTSERQTAIQAVVLDEDRFAVTLHDYEQDRSSKIKTKLVRR